MEGKRSLTPTEVSSFLSILRRAARITNVMTRCAQWLLLVVLLILCKLAAATASPFGANLVQGGDSTVSGAYNYWSVGSDCEIDDNQFSVKPSFVLSPMTAT
ncbi:membrane-associated protein, putative [Bodo saltans]|uniref:Membrane-associated protein, putative n=1 Tax=Bodo saltans TaxID=75058 RepID=A0A0S4IVJ3_BODSA|nr:membrane-associated protein, putative [Bodo saltans]|eukprot:CUG03712.1 membrane-associated protein, putative [Bodo saltans]